MAKKKVKKKVAKKRPARKLAQTSTPPKPKPQKNFLNRVKTLKLFDWVRTHEPMVKKESMEYLAAKIEKDLGFSVHPEQQLPRFLSDMGIQVATQPAITTKGVNEILHAIHTLSSEVRDLNVLLRNELKNCR